MPYQTEYFITGACGMIGSHLVERLGARNTPFVGTWYNPQAWQPPDAPPFFECDVRYFTTVWERLEKTRPRVIIHAAAQSYPTVSWEKPEETIAVNVIGTINIFEAVKRLRQQEPGYDPLVLVTCSSAQYGLSMLSQEGPVPEEAPMLPLHPYGVSKVAQDNLAHQYFLCDGIRSIRARIFNTTGPRKKHDVVSDWAKRIVRIERGMDKILTVGNLAAKRAIMDVSDLINALLLLVEKGRPGEAYNICHDHVQSMEEVLQCFRTLSRVDFRHEIDPALLRPADEAIIFGNNGKLKHDTGWQCATGLEKTISHVLEHERLVFAHD